MGIEFHLKNNAVGASAPIVIEMQLFYLRDELKVSKTTISHCT